MEKELKIIPPIGYEIDRQNSTFEKIVFKKIPKNTKTWEDEPIEVELRPTITDIDANANEYANSVTDNKEIKELIINAFKAGYNS